MILELCQFAQEFLSSKNKKPIDSFHESMIKKHFEKEDHEKRKRAESEKKELKEIALENERRRLEMLNRKEDEEFEEKNRVKMLNFGELGEGELIEPLDSDKNRRIYKLVNSKPRRSAISRYATEWSAYDKVVILLSLKNILELTSVGNRMVVHLHVRQRESSKT